MELTDFGPEINRVENYPDFKNLAHVIQQGFIVKNIEGESTEAYDLRLGSQRRKFFRIRKCFRLHQYESIGIRWRLH